MCIILLVFPPTENMWSRKAPAKKAWSRHNLKDSEMWGTFDPSVCVWCFPRRRLWRWSGGPRPGAAGLPVGPQRRQWLHAAATLAAPGVSVCLPVRGWICSHIQRDCVFVCSAVPRMHQNSLSEQENTLGVSVKKVSCLTKTVLLNASEEERQKRTFIQLFHAAGTWTGNPLLFVHLPPQSTITELEQTG